MIDWDQRECWRFSGGNLSFHSFVFFEVNLLCHLLNPCNVTFPSKLLPNRLKCYWPDLPFVTSGENLEMFPAKTVLE